MDTSAAPREIYANRLQTRTQLLRTHQNRQANLGSLRLLVFLAAAAIFWYTRWYWVAAPVVVFILLIWLQSRAGRSAECARRAIAFYERGIARLENRWASPARQNNSPETGERFADPHHPYAADLDLFGHASLFQLLSTARTRGGEAKLAAWLKSPSDPAELHARHEAIDELRPLLDLREALVVLGDDVRPGTNPDHLIAWATSPPQPFPNWMRLLALVLATAAFSSLVWFFTGVPNATLALAATGVIAALFAAPLRTRVLDIVNAAEEPAHDLDLFSQILATLECHQFQSPRLTALRQAIETTIDTGHDPASARISQLRRLTDMLESRENPVVRAVGPLVLWTTQLAMALESWRIENGPHIADWLNAVSEIEALSALASYAFEHPSDPFPEFASDTPAPWPVFEGENLGHPLLPDDRCVRNTVALHHPLCLLIVSGSNMSGKSTLLRTIGVNTVLALAGAPVRASRLLISPLSLGASIRATDSLEEGQSRFMAEILRLKQILELTPPALFLLDELLGGTNSHDRAVGSEGLIRALLDRGAIGLVTTHDLSLARVVDDLATAAANVHFEDRLENGRLVFDYTMRPGVVTRSNALDLMRAVGLDV